MGIGVVIFLPGDLRKPELCSFAPCKCIRAGCRAIDFLRLVTHRWGALRRHTKSSFSYELSHPS